MSRTENTESSRLLGSTSYSTRSVYNDPPNVEHEHLDGCSNLRAKIVSGLVLVLTMSTSTACDTLLAQYLLSRLADDEGYRNASHLDTCPKNTSDPAVQEVDRLQAAESHIIMMTSLVQAAPSFVACLLVGSYSDYLGRRLLVVAPVITMWLRMVIIGLVIRLSLPIWMLYVAFGIEGISGSWFSLLLALCAVAADIHPDVQQRSMWIVSLFCASAVTSASVSVAEGYIIKDVDFFWVAVMLVINTSIAAVAAVMLPETRHRHNTDSAPVILHPGFHLKRMFGFYFIHGSVRKRLTFCIGLSIFFFGIINDLSAGSVDARYVTHEPFCWSSALLGIYVAVRLTVPYFGGILMLKAFQHCVGDEKLATVGAVFYGAGYLYEAFITESWQFFIVPAILTPGTLTVPIARSMMSVLAGEDHHGAIFSSIAVVETLCNMMSTSVFNSVYSASVASWPGCTYVIMAAFSFFTFFLFLLFFTIRQPTMTTTSVPDIPKMSIQQSECKT